MGDEAIAGAGRRVLLERSWVAHADAHVLSRRPDRGSTRAYEAKAESSAVALYCLPLRGRVRYGIVAAQLVRASRGKLMDKAGKRSRHDG